jgi:hypothetical protein
MATFTLNLADRLKARAETQAADAGFESLDEYVASLIESDVAVPIPESLEADLRSGLNGPWQTMTAADWDHSLQRLLEKHRK